MNPQRATRKKTHLPAEILAVCSATLVLIRCLPYDLFYCYDIIYDITGLWISQNAMQLHAARPGRLARVVYETATCEWRLSDADLLLD